MFKFLKNTKNVLLAVVLILGVVVYINYGLSKESDKDNIEINALNYESQNEANQKELGVKIADIIRNLWNNLSDIPNFSVTANNNGEANEVQSEVQVYVVGEEETTLEAVTLEYVVDGDTLIVTDANGFEFKVRLIGLDTAESVHVDESRNNIYGIYASDHTKELLSSTTTLYLEYDEETQDMYGRTLAYVWLTPDTEDCNNLLNYIILRDGYAYYMEIAPNVKYSSLLSSTYNHAKSINAGLWNEEEFRQLWN